MPTIDFHVGGPNIRLTIKGPDLDETQVPRPLADGGLDRPPELTFHSGPPSNLRRMLVDLYDGYARHVGHADVFRETVDGLVGEDPP